MGRCARGCQGWQKTPPTLIASLAYGLLLAVLPAWAVDARESLTDLEPAGIASSAHSLQRAAVTPDDYTVAPIPDWVRPAPAFAPGGHSGPDSGLSSGLDSGLASGLNPGLNPGMGSGLDSGPSSGLYPVAEGVSQTAPGYRAQLQDFQFNGLVPHHSSHFNAAEYVLTGQSGVEKYSIITIPYDSGYERLNLHELWIKRGEALIDKLPEARFDILPAGRDSADQLHPATRTLVISLDDIRIGDRLRYSYSREGENPVYQGHRELRIHTEHLSPLDRQYTRVLSSSDRAFNRRVRGRDVPLQISDSDGVQEIVIDQRGVRKYSPEQDVPSWRIDRGTVVFSDMQNWHSVVDWALPMYRLPEHSDPEIATIASVIQTTHQDPAERIAVALRWVQEEIRTLYAGIDTGAPLTDPGAHAEVDIHPRWSSHRPSRSTETLTQRIGDGRDKALLLIALLRELGVDDPEAAGNAATLRVVTTRSGVLAEQARSTLQIEGVNGLAGSFRDHHADYFEGISPLARPSFEDSGTNRITVTERYRIPAFWMSDENAGRSRWIYAGDILAHLDMPPGILDRRLPYAPVHPLLIEETWELLMPQAYQVDPLDVTLVNDWMSFSRRSSTSEDNRRLSVTLRYQSLADEVAAEDIGAYAAAIQSIRDMASFRIRDKPPMAGVPGRVLNHLWQGLHAGAGWLWFAFARP